MILIEHLESAWEFSDALFDLVHQEALQDRPIALRNPLIFYVGHLPAFTWNLLFRGVLQAGDSSRPEFDRLFDFGIDPEEGEEQPPTPDWPNLAEILRYRDQVRADVRERADEISQRAGADVLADHDRVLHVVLEHEVMHHETLLYMLQELPPERMVRGSWFKEPTVGSEKGPKGSVRIPAGKTRLGANFDEISFGWDNEFPARTKQVEAFELDVAPVTIAEWREFQRDGGYRQASFWSERAWAWAHKTGLTHPHGWSLDRGRWFVRSVFDEIPIEEVGAWPVSVSLAEAEAYARWKGRRLPTEAELYRAAFGSKDAQPFPWGQTARPHHGNFDFQHHSPTPVGLFPAGASGFGVQELVGNGWEWNSTPFASHPGFDAYMRGYSGYSADFFDGAHYAMFGGSWATGSCLLRRSFRNWFRFNYPFPFTKFRLASS